MKIFIKIFLLAAVIGCGAPSSEDNAAAAIRQLSGKFSSDYIRSDFEAIANAYAEDAVIMPPGRDAIKGRKAIFDFWSGLPKTYRLLIHRIEPDTIFVMGNEAHDYGYFFTQSQKEGEDAGPVLSAKYYIVWEKDKAGDWKMKMDMWNMRDPEWNNNQNP